MSKLLDKYEIVNAVYNAALFTAGAAVVNYASKKLAKKDFGIPTNPMAVVKLGATIGVGSVLIATLRKNDPFKKMLPSEIWTKPTG